MHLYICIIKSINDDLIPRKSVFEHVPKDIGITVIVEVETKITPLTLWEPYVKLSFNKRSRRKSIMQSLI